MAQSTSQITQGYTVGVKYLKINKIDGNGNDATAYLENCQTLNIGYQEDNYSATYDVISRTDKGTYFLFNVSPLNTNGYREPFSSSIRYNWGFKVSATGVTFGSASPVAPVFANISTADFDVRGNWVQGVDKGGSPFAYYYNDKTTSFPIGHKLLGNIVNSGGKQTIELQIFAYPFAPGGTGDIASPYIIYREDIICNAGGSTPLIKNFYYPLIENKRYVVQFTTASGSPLGQDITNLTFNNISWTFTSASYHEYAPFSQSVIPDPQIFNDNYDYSEYNPILNNATDERFSTRFLEVDYDNSNIIPSNLSLIQRNAAPFADVKDYYYSLKCHTLPRYEGSRLISNGFNIRGKDGQPPAEQNHTLFTNCLGAGGQSPEYIDKTFFFTDKIIDSNGNVFNAKDPNIPQYVDYKYIFPEGSDVIVNLEASTAGFLGYKGLSGTHKVLRIGTLQTKLITGYNTGSNDYVDKLTFVAAEGTEEAGINDYRLTAYRSSDVSSLGGGTNTLVFDNEAFNDGDGTYYTYNNTTGIYTFGTDPSEVTVTIEVAIKVENERFTLNPDTDTVTLKLLKDASVVLDSETVDISTDSGEGGGTHTFTLSYTGIFEDTDNLRIQLSSTYGQKTFKSAGSSYQITQNPSPGGSAEDTTFVNVTDALGNLSLAEGNFLVFSENISTNYGLKQVLSSSQTEFGYSQNVITTFEPTPGDEIRFGYNEDNAYTITKVYPPGSIETQPTRLYVELNKVIPTSIGTTRNHFLIRSYKDDNAGMTLDVKKEYSNSGDGTTKESTIRPLYISKELENNFPDIIRTLANEGII